MQHDPKFQRFARRTYLRDGPRLRERHPQPKWRFRWVQLRVLVLAIPVCILAWWQLLG